jgi:hypothetical protein
MKNTREGLTLAIIWIILAMPLSVLSQARGNQPEAAAMTTLSDRGTQSLECKLLC